MHNSTGEPLFIPLYKAKAAGGGYCCTICGHASASGFNNYATWSDSACPFILHKLPLCDECYTFIIERRVEADAAKRKHPASVLDAGWGDDD